MSRIRTGHTPDAWKEEGPSTARIYQNVYAVSAVVIGAMKPILSAGGNWREGSTGNDWRKTMNAEAAARYRARKAA